MGASGWAYRVPLTVSVEQTFTAVQEGLISKGHYIWPWDGVDDDAFDEAVAARPTSLAELHAAKEIEAFWEQGTHSLLDLHRIGAAAEEDQFGTIRPLTSQELQALFATEEPSVEALDDLTGDGAGGPLLELTGPRWSGRCLVAHTGGEPSHVYFWGWSGD